eukprot:6570534-Prymnesium_polylepis.1
MVGGDDELAGAGEAGRDGSGRRWCGMVVVVRLEAAGEAIEWEGEALEALAGRCRLSWAEMRVLAVTGIEAVATAMRSAAEKPATTVARPPMTASCSCRLLAVEQHELRHDDVDDALWKAHHQPVEARVEMRLYTSSRNDLTTHPGPSHRGGCRGLGE